MSVELRPLGVRCNIACQYCYQNAHRDAGNGFGSYDLNAMKRAIEEEGGPFHLFGGEPLLMEAADLEEMFRWGLERFGENGLQTNGVLLNDGHLRMFRQYKVRVGLSIDGPGALNDARWAGTLERTREATRKSERAIERLVGAGIAPGIMIQVSRCNAASERLPEMLAWLRRLDRLGVRSARLHILEVENDAVREKYGMSAEENLLAMTALLDLEKGLGSLRFDLGGDMKDLLRGEDAEAPCVWRACDPYTTEAVHGVDGDGERHNCGLTDKEGIHFQKPDRAGFERVIALYHTPEEYGGCKGCRFFLACKGQCPGTGIGGDWRNKTEYCAVWKGLFTRIEAELIAEGAVPLSRDPRRPQWEGRALEKWAEGENLSLAWDLS